MPVDLEITPLLHENNRFYSRIESETTDTSSHRNNHQNYVYAKASVRPNQEEQTTNEEASKHGSKTSETFAEPETGGVKKRKKLHIPTLTTLQRILVFLSSTYYLFSTSGFLFGFGNIYADMILTLGISRTEASLVQSLVRATSMGGGFVAGPLVKRFGDTRCAVVGALLSSSGLIISYFLTNVIALTFFIGIVTGSGIALVFIVSYTSVSALFSHDPALGLSLVSIGVGLGMMVSPMVTESMIEISNWNGALLMFAGLMLNNLVGCSVIYVFMDKWRTVSTGSTEKPRVFDKQLFQNHYYNIILPCSFLIGITLQVEVFFLVDHMMILGYEFETGAYLLTVLGIAGLTCRVVEGITFKFLKSKAINHLTVCMLIVTIGHLMFVIFEDYWSLFGGVVLIGIGQSICGALMSPLTVDIIGVGLLPVGYGILNSLNGMGNAICGVIGGYMFDLLGSYKLVFLSAAAGTAIVLIVFIALWFKLRNHRPEYQRIIDA